MYIVNDFELVLFFLRKMHGEMPVEDPDVNAASIECIHEAITACMRCHEIKFFNRGIFCIRNLLTFPI